MTNPFVLIYRFFRNNRPFFYLFLLFLTGLITILGSQIRFEEDISRITGGNDTANRFEYVTTHHQFAEKLIIRLTQRDTAAPADPDQLSAIAASFIDSLNLRFDSTFVRDIRGNVPDSLVNVYMDFFYDHLPIYLDDADYQKLEGWMNQDSLNRITERNFHSLVTPAGFALKKNISRDPLGLTFLALKKLQSLQTGNDYDLVNGFIFTKDHRNLLLMITPANPPDETSKNAELVRGIDEILDHVTPKTVSSGYFGAAAMAVGNAETLKADVIFTITIALLLIVALIGWYFRSIKIPLLGFLPAAFGGGFALAIICIAKGSMSTIALGVGSVILGLIVDYALYLVTRFRKTGNIEQSITDLTPAILLCAITSAGAFMCLVFLKSVVLHDLGWFATLSVIGAAIFALIILPQFLNEEDIRGKQSENLVDRLLAIPLERKMPLVLMVITILIVSFFLIRKVDFEKNMMAMNYTTEKLAQAQSALERISDVSKKSIYVVSTGNNLEEALKANEKTEKYLSGLKNIASSSGIRQVLLSDSLQQERINRWKNFWSPERKENFREMLEKSGKKYGFKPGVFASFYTLTENKQNVLSEDVKNRLIRLFLSDFVQRTDHMVMITSVVTVPEVLRATVRSSIPPDPHRIAFDRQQLTERFITGVKADFELLVTLSMIFVTLLLLISFGRIELALFSALPMYAGWVITLGFMGITGIKFNIFNIILSSFIFGLGVDYSILMMRGLLNEYKYGRQDISSYKVSVFLSGLTTIIGVGALFFAKHPALNSIALISVFGITAVVLVTYTIQPYLFTRLVSDRAARGRFPVTFRVFIKTIITWTNIILIAIIMMIAGLFLFILPFPKKKKEYCFHFLFSKLSKLYIAITFPTNRKLINEHHEDFSKPAIIVSNHQSLIETPSYLRLHPRILILTNDWVWNSPLFGPIARLASFFNADHGLDLIMDKLRAKVAEGYSILIFPEGHRSEDGHIQRFHRGAFYLAEQLQIDILPVVIFGSGEFLGKNAIWGRPSPLVMKILSRISPSDLQFGSTYSERTRGVRKLFREEYEKIRATEQTPHYFRKKLILNYVLKGPVLEWYLRIKMILSDNYSIFDRLIPKEGKILDIGCGYGYISYMLMMTSPKRIITGVDFDGEKISVATNGFLKNDRIRFECVDITQFPIEPSRAYLLSDVLHYLPYEDQEKLLHNCIENLEPGGIIVIRDADASDQKNHKRSKFTEFLSTKVIRFNKTLTPDKTLNFTSSEKIEKIAGEYQLKLEIIEEAKHTSNILMVIRK